MSPDKKTLGLSILLIAIGTGWLLTALKLVPGINWVWSLSLAAIGLVTFAVAGFDKVTVVVAPFFMLASLLSVLRQTGRLHIDVEVPILVITAGLLLLIARAKAVPAPAWAVQGPRAGPPD